MTIDRPGAARSRLVACTATALALVLCACGQENRYVAPPPPKVTVAMPVKQKVTRYLEATGYASAINTTNLVARVQGFLQKINYKDGDQVKEGATLRHRARAVQARARQCDGQSRLRARPAQAGGGRYRAGRAQSRLHAGEGSLRRHRHGAPGVAGRTGGRQWPHPTRHHRPNRSDLRELQCQRAGGAEHSRGHAAPRHDRGGPQNVSDRSRAADRPRISVSGHAELRFSLHRPGDRNACRPRHPAECRAGAGAGQFRARASWRRRRAGVAAGTGFRARQRPRRTLFARARQQQYRRAAQGHDRPQGRRPARDRERAQARRSHRRCRHPAGDPGSEGRSATCDRRCDAGPGRGRQIAAAHDLRFFHRAARSCERACHFDDRDRRRRHVCAAGGAVPRRGAADGASHHALSRGKRPHLVDTVALPIEQQVNGVEGMIYMQSYSGADGSYSLTVTFKIGADLDIAQVLVQNRVSSALSSLPQAVQAQGVIVQKNSTAILQIVTLTSPDARYDSLYLANYATIKLKDEIARLPGVGNVVVFGAGQYSMRVWLDPNKMQARGLMPQDVIETLRQQSTQVTAGQIGAPPAPRGQTFQYTLNVTGRLSDPAEFAQVIVKTDRAGEITRLSDVGRVELGSQTYGQVFTLDGQPAAGLAIYQAPGANALNVANEVRDKLAVLNREFPQGLISDIPFDTTKFVEQSIHEVYKTLYEAAVLVLIVILLFLQDWRAMLIPATTVPVTIIGAFAAMAALGFTVNFSTLFAIVLAIGIVVDDAIVVVEGAVHNIEKGMSGREAASAAMRQLFGPIIGITLVLMSVFLPAAFLPGLTGRMYAQFALVIAAAASTWPSCKASPTRSWPMPRRSRPCRWCSPRSAR